MILAIWAPLLLQTVATRILFILRLPTRVPLTTLLSTQRKKNSLGFSTLCWQSDSATPSKWKTKLLEVLGNTSLLFANCKCKSSTSFKMKSDAGLEYSLWHGEHFNSAKDMQPILYFCLCKDCDKLYNFYKLGFYFSAVPPPWSCVGIDRIPMPLPFPSVTQKLFAFIFSFLPFPLTSTCSPGHSSFHWIEILVNIRNMRCTVFQQIFKSPHSLLGPVKTLWCNISIPKILWV